MYPLHIVSKCGRVHTSSQNNPVDASDGMGRLGDEARFSQLTSDPLGFDEFTGSANIDIIDNVLAIICAPRWSN